MFIDSIELKIALPLRLASINNLAVDIVDAAYVMDLSQEEREAFLAKLRGASKVFCRTLFVNLVGSTTNVTSFSLATRCGKPVY